MVLVWTAVFAAATDVGEAERRVEPGGADPGVEAIEEVSAAALVPADDPYRQELEAFLRAAPDAPPDVSELAASMVLFERSIAWRTGNVPIRDGAIVLSLGEGDQYADPDGASKVLEAWGNPPDGSTDGLLLPKGAHLFGANSWAVLVRFQDDGWVDDSDAASIDYDELLGQMKDANAEGSAERRKMGLDGVELTGWAEPPRYDSPSNVLYWATLLKSDSGGVTLNYDVRVLGRRGVLSLNALADEGALTQVKGDMERVRALAAFQEGHRYADYVEGTDTKAAYGIAALVAGGAVAAKTGLLKGLLAALIAGKKLVIAGVVAAAALVRGFFQKLTGRSRPESQ